MSRENFLAIFAAGILLIVPVATVAQPTMIEIPLGYGGDMIDDEDWPSIEKALVGIQPNLPLYFQEGGREFSKDWLRAVWFDFDDDGIQDLFVVVSNISNCGTGGCYMSILKRDQDGFILLSDGGATYTADGLVARLRRNEQGAWVNF